MRLLIIFWSCALVIFIFRVRILVALTILFFPKAWVGDVLLRLYDDPEVQKALEKRRPK